MFSGTILILKHQIINKISQFVFFLSPVVPSSKESHGSEALFGPDVDYFGDFYRTGSKSKKQQEEPLGSVCKTSSESVLRLIHC